MEQAETAHAAAAATADANADAADAADADAAAADAADADAADAADADAAAASSSSSVLGRIVSGANVAAAAVRSVSDSLHAAASTMACKPPTPDWAMRPLNYLVPLESPSWPAACPPLPSVGIDAAAATQLCDLASHVSRRFVTTSVTTSATPPHP
jgi:hypothetical protein